METSLTVEDDKVGDILYLGKTKAYLEQDSEELDYGVVARLNPQTHDLENLEVLFFSSRVAKGETFQLPVTAEFHLPKADDAGHNLPRLVDSRSNPPPIDLPLRVAFSPAHPLARRDVPLARARVF